FNPPLGVFSSLELGPLERISAQVDQLRQAKRYEWVLPHVETNRALFQKQNLPAVVAQGCKVAVVGPVEILLALTWAGAGQQITLVITVEMDLEGLTGRLITGQEFLRDVGVTGGRYQRRHPVFMREELVDLGALLDDAWPADHAGDAIATFPTRV